MFTWAEMPPIPGSLLLWGAVGLLAAWLAQLSMGGGGRMVAENLVLGLLGAVAGGFLMAALDPGPEPLLGTTLFAFIGAGVCIFFCRTLFARRVRR